MAIALLTCTAVVFRAEVALLLIPLCLQFLFTKRLAFLHLIRVGIVSGLLSTGIQYCPHPCGHFLTYIPFEVLTVVVDSYFWVTFPLWPELAGIHFNVFQGKSAEWGVSMPGFFFPNEVGSCSNI